MSALFDIAQGSWGEVAERAAGAALALTDDLLELAAALLHLDNGKIVRMALAAIEGEPFQKIVELVYPLLRSDSLEIRKAAVLHFAKRVSRPQLRGLIDAYSRGQYYYNVVVEIDRLLYAPAWLRHAMSKTNGY